MRKNIRASTAALVPGALALAAVLAGPAPARGEPVGAAAAGHPRLLLSEAELPARRAKVAEPGTVSKYLFDKAVSRTPTGTQIPDKEKAMDANTPAFAILAPTQALRDTWASRAIASSLNAINAYEPAYPVETNAYTYWRARALYRYIALTYDCCHDRMTDPQRAAFQEEMMKICSLMWVTADEKSPGNHQIVDAVALGLTAMALEGDVPVAPRTYADVPAVRKASPWAGELLPHRSSFSMVRVGRVPGESFYVEGKDGDYEVKWLADPADVANQGFGIVWKAGKGPSAGTTYYATYSFTPDIPLWKDRARSLAQRNLDLTWADGASQAGVGYGGWTLWWMVDLFEALRRNDAFDFSAHPNVREAVRWLPSEMIPGTPYWALRCNNRNDGFDTDLDNVTRYQPYLCWLQSRFAGDPEGRDALARWILARSDKWTNFTSWREAVWAAGPWPIPAQPEPAIPLSRVFRGHGLANLRTGAWDGPTADWSLLSFTGGPATGMEHDQTDKGSFTFHACGEELAIDSGYAMGDRASDATAAHNYLLIDGAGQPGPWDTSADFRVGLLSSWCDAVHTDLRRSFLNTQLWTDPAYKDPAAWPVRRADRHVLFLKRAGRAPFAVVSDLVDKNGTARGYDWLLHTRTGNAVSISGTTATVTGANGLGTMKVFLSGAATPVLTQDVWAPAAGSGLDPHPRLKARVSAVDPQFLAVLVPEKVGEPDPLAVSTAQGAGWASATVTGGGLTDTVVQNRMALLASVAAGDLETDGAVAAVRTDAAGGILGWSILGGTTLRWRGQILWSVQSPSGARGSAAFDGASLSVVADEATALWAHAPGLSSFAFRDWTLPGTRSGNLLIWNGTRRMLDTPPAGIFALSEDFSSSVAPFWHPHFLGKSQYARVEGGAFRSSGRRKEWISFTRRASYHQNVEPQQRAHRADVSPWPRTRFRDAALTGTFTIQSFTAGNVLGICARTRDVSYPASWTTVPGSEMGIDQEVVRVTINPQNGLLTLQKRMEGGVYTTLAQSTAPVPVGTPHAYVLEAAGSRIRFALDGVDRIDFTDGGAFPAEGYLQWEVPQGMDVRLDDVKVALPGATVPPPPPSVVGASPSIGPTGGGTSVTVAGFDFQPGASVSFGGSPATNVAFVNGNTLTCLTPPHAAGTVDVVVTNPDGRSGTLAGGFSFTAGGKKGLVPKADSR